MRGKLSLVLMGGAMLRKSLIEFSVDGWGHAPSLLFTWGQTMVARILKWVQFPSPVDNILSGLSIMTRLFWVALHGMTHSFIELDKAAVHVIRLVSLLCL